MPGPTLLPFEHFWFVTVTSYTAILAGAVLWIGFGLMGFVARRFEQAYQLVTHWPFYFIAPAGVFAYLLLQAMASLQHENMGPVEQWIGYALLVWSAGLCWWGCYRFWRVLTYLSRRHD
ncbi:MAG: hypothetical protein AB1439_05680 [candidate division FCPU426 bacterium]